MRISALRRRGRAHLQRRSAHRRDRRGAPVARAVPGVALRHRRGAAEGGDRGHRGRADRAARRARERRASCSKRSGCACAPTTTSRCCARSGSCAGVENYSMHLDGRQRHQPPYTLLDYFPDDWLCVVDESHVAIPQLHGQFEGDRSRKETLVAHGFRLPSAMDNRPLRFEEFIERVNQVVFMSATPGPYEREIVHAGRRAGRAPDRPHRSRGDREADEGPDRRSRRRDQRPHRRRSARARHHAHQEDVGGPHRLPARARRSACATCTPRSTRSSASRSCGRCGSASSTCWSASTCCGKGSTCPRSRSSRSSTPTRKASCGRRRR